MIQMTKYRMAIIHGAMLAVLAIATPLLAQQPQVTLDVEGTQLTLKGPSWEMRYGTRSFTSLPDEDERPLWVPVAGGRGWFSNGTYLRLLDARRGQVLGRWRFPGVILSLVPQDGKVEVEVHLGKERDLEFRRSLIFDPANPDIPDWSIDTLFLAKQFVDEAFGAGIFLGPEYNPVAATPERIASLENMVRRDPSAVIFRMGLGRALSDRGDPRGPRLLEETASWPGLHYAERFLVSSYLDTIGEHGLARVAFESAYRDFLDRGNDPRLIGGLIGRLLTYLRGRPKPDEAGQTPALREELIDRFYRLGPYAEGAEFAWHFYAKELREQGRDEEAAIWQARADEMWTGPMGLNGFLTAALHTGPGMLISFGAVWAGLFFLIGLHFRYHPQGKLTAASRRRFLGVAHGWSFFGLEYWDRRQRMAFLLIVLIGWFGAGLTGVWMQVILKYAATPIPSSMGNLTHPMTIWYLENRFAPTPENNLFLAVAYHQSGDLERAEEYYRKTPQFARSWNNLGVLLSQSGRDQEARAAFEVASERNPELPEARLNLGQPPSDYWTTAFHGYFPGRPMLAPPTPKQALRMYQGGSELNSYLKALAGPLYGDFRQQMSNLVSGPLPSRTGMKIFVLISIGVLAAAIALVAFIPTREVTQPPRRWHWIVELLFPGIAPQWSIWGGPILLAWCYLGLQALFIFESLTANIIARISLPNVARSYAVNVPSNAELFSLINPGHFWVYGVPLLLFAFNAWLVWRNRPARTV